MKLRNLLSSPTDRHSEKGAITIVETLIVLSIGLIALTVLAQAKLSEFRANNAANAGRAIAAYSRAASVWLAENPPAADGTFTISNLQDCADPDGARYLSCTFGAQTPVVYARNDTGDPVNYGNLDIDVVITPEGATGVIDFGVFRAGDDENEDGLPDSRPDLASIAFQTAAEESGAGVLEFFEMRFVRESPLGLEFDPDEAGFDQAAIDDLSRLQARVGALAGDAPFLRLDGANEMSAGINFDNGMQVNMDGVGLEFQGPGDVGVRTDTGTLVVAQNIQTAALQSGSAVIDELTVEPLTGVKGAGFERLNQAPDVIRIDDDVIRLTSRVQTNETDIIANRQNITDNETDINRLTGEVNDNETAINANQRSISANRNSIASQGRTLARHGSDIHALQNTPPPPPPPPPFCSPSYTQANAAAHAGNPGYQYNRTCDCNYGEADCDITRDRCPGYEAPEGPDHRSGQGTGSSIAFNYQTRDSYTLQCTGNTASIYERCHVTITETNCQNIH